MWGSDVSCSQNSPFCIEPHLGKVMEDNAETPLGKERGVFNESMDWLHFPNDAGHVSPEARTGTCDADSFSRAGDVLAWKPARNNVNNAPPWVAIKGLHVRPNREWQEMSIDLPLCKNLCGESVNLNGTDGPPSKEMSPKNSSTSTREKSQLIHLASGLRV